MARRRRARVTRTDLQRHDLSAPGREAIQVRVDLAPGVAFGKHTHPGEEIIYVLEGTLEYQVEDKPPVTLKAGDVLFVPAETPHSAQEPRQRHRQRARHLHRRERQAAPHAGEVMAAARTYEESLT